MMRSYLLLLIFVLGLPLSGVAKQDKGPSPVAGMRDKIVEASASSDGQDASFQVQASHALSLIREAELLHQDDPKNQMTHRKIRACSLAVASTLLKFEASKLSIKIKKAQAERDSALLEINRIYQKINQIERTHSNTLMSDLEEERKKALERQEDARKRFDALQSDVINVKKDARGIILSMSDILFAIGKSNLTQDLKTNLAKIAGILTVYKEAKILVEGHTDNVGGEEYNQKLSERRAEEVMKFLVAQGLTQERLQSAGLGLTKPVADNGTAEGRQQNRRVDLIISEKKE